MKEIWRNRSVKKESHSLNSKNNYKEEKKKSSSLNSKTNELNSLNSKPLTSSRTTPIKQEKLKYSLFKSSTDPMLYLIKKKNMNNFGKVEYGPDIDKSEE
jgi:hypothetical protein